MNNSYCVILFITAFIVALISTGTLVDAQRKFCPSATPNKTRCESAENQYKCGVFFLDLPGREHLSWIGGLPDIFKKRVSLRFF